MRARQAGYTLVELSITVSIIAVLLVGTLTGVQRLLRANQSNNAITQTQAAISAIAKLFATTGFDIFPANATTAANTNTLAQLGVWDPAAVRTVANLRTVVNPFSGGVTVVGNTTVIGTGVTQAAIASGYWYRIGGVPQSTCASLATAFLNTATAIYVSSGVAATTGALPAGTNAGYLVPGTAANTGNLALACGATAETELSLFIPS